MIELRIWCAQVPRPPVMMRTRICRFRNRRGPHIPARQVQLDRNSAPEFVLPLPPGDVPPGHEVCSPLSIVWSGNFDSRRVAFPGTSLPACLGCPTTRTFQWGIPTHHSHTTAFLQFKYTTSPNQCPPLSAAKSVTC